MCREMGIKLAVCGCKDERLKETDIEWICHPFNRKRREELNENVSAKIILLSFRINYDEFSRRNPILFLK